VDGSPPPALLDHVAIYDPVRDRMLVFGGATSRGHPVNDTLRSRASGKAPAPALVRSRITVTSCSGSVRSAALAVPIVSAATPKRIIQRFIADLPAYR
jgi:hypothetical protein